MIFGYFTVFFFQWFFFSMTFDRFVTDARESRQIRSILRSFVFIPCSGLNGIRNWWRLSISILRREICRDQNGRQQQKSQRESKNNNKIMVESNNSVSRRLKTTTKSWCFCWVEDWKAITKSTSVRATNEKQHQQQTQAGLTIETHVLCTFDVYFQFTVRCQAFFFCCFVSPSLLDFFVFFALAIVFVAGLSRPFFPLPLLVLLLCLGSSLQPLNDSACVCVCGYSAAQSESKSIIWAVYVYKWKWQMSWCWCSFSDTCSRSRSVLFQKSLVLVSVAVYLVQKSLRTTIDIDTGPSNEVKTESIAHNHELYEL